MSGQVLTFGSRVSEREQAAALTGVKGCRSEWDEWLCTLPAGHDGEHEAGTGPDDDGRTVVAAVWS